TPANKVRAGRARLRSPSARYKPRKIVEQAPINPASSAAGPVDKGGVAAGPMVRRPRRSINGLRYALIATPARFSGRKSRAKKSRTKDINPPAALPHRLQPPMGN